MKNITSPILILAVALTVFPADWPQFKRTPDRQGCSLSESIVLPSKLCAWFDFGSPILSSPAIVNDKVYIIANNGLLACIDLSTNQVLWSKKFVGGSNQCSPAVADGKVYVSAATGHFYVLEAATGTILNQYDAGGIILASPLLLPSGIYFGSCSGIFHALDLDGNLKWRDTASLSINHEAAFYNGQIFYTDDESNMIWLEDSGTYAKRVRKITLGPAVNSTVSGFASYPMICRDTIWAGLTECEMASTHNVTGFSFTTGTVLKIIQINGSLASTCYGGASMDTLNAFRIIASANGGIEANLWNEVPHWTTTPDYNLFPDGLYGGNTAPAIINGCVIFGSENNQDTGGCAVHFYRTVPGAPIQLWSYRPASYKAISGHPAVSDGRVLVGSMDGCVYGFWDGFEVTSAVIVDSQSTTLRKTAAALSPGTWTLNVFPNPAFSERVSLELTGIKGKAEIAIYGVNGNLIRTLSAQNKNAVQWDLRDNRTKTVASGNYYAVVRNNDGRQVRAFNLQITR